MNKKPKKGDIVELDYTSAAVDSAGYVNYCCPGDLAIITGIVNSTYSRNNESYVTIKIIKNGLEIVCPAFPCVKQIYPKDSVVYILYGN